MNMKNYLLFLFVLLLIEQTYGQDQIILDENFNDWENQVFFEDPGSDNPNNGIDILSLGVSNDDEYIYFNFNFDEEINIQNDNDLILYVDSDNDSNTGLSINGIGADLRYFFGSRDGIVTVNGQTKFVEHYDVGLVTIPTVTSSQFELLFRRQGILDANGFAFGSTIRFVLKDNAVSSGDTAPNSGSYVYELTDKIIEYPIYSIDPALNTTRILSMNVLQDGLFDINQRDAIKDIISATRPDILAFQEIYDHSSEQVKNVIADLFPSSDWYHGQVQPDIIVVSKYPILQSFATDGNGSFLIDHPARELLLVNVHLPCCDKDYDRQQEVDKLMAFIRESKMGNSIIPLEENTPIVIVGDMNFVGLNRQRKTLLEGDINDVNNFGGDFNPDWDGTALKDAVCPTTSYPGSITWSNRFSSFGPGRLDYIIYTDSQIELKNSFALNTLFLNQDQLDEYNLNILDTDNASDHFALIADFDLGSIVNTASVNKKSVQIKTWPNPAKELVQISLTYALGKKAEIVMVSLDGKTYRKIFNGKINQKYHELDFDTKNLPSGSYLIKIRIDDKMHYRRIKIIQ